MPCIFSVLLLENANDVVVDSDHSINMPSYKLQVKCVSESIKSFECTAWAFNVIQSYYKDNCKFMCVDCSTNTPSPVYINKDELFPHPNSRAENNLVMKCKFCKHLGSVDIVSEHVFECGEEVGAVTMVVLECRFVNSLCT